MLVTVWITTHRYGNLYTWTDDRRFVSPLYNQALRVWLWVQHAQLTPTGAKHLSVVWKQQDMIAKAPLPEGLFAPAVGSVGRALVALILPQSLGGSVCETQMVHMDRFRSCEVSSSKLLTQLKSEMFQK